MAKLFGLNGVSFNELVDTINNYNSNYKVLATQVFRDEQENCWYALIYYEGELKNEEQPKKVSLATESQKNLLKKLGVKFPEDLTKSEAFKLLNEKLPKK